MAELRPFRGIYYNPERAGDLSRLLAPPYDVLDREDRAELEARSPYNVVRLLLGELAWGESPGTDTYAECQRLWREWRQADVLTQDPRPCFYHYRQRFLSEGEAYTRRGLIALVRLAPYSEGVVLPHEQTLAKAKEDRFRLLKACRANFDSVYGLYDDPEGEVRSLLEPAEGSEPLLRGSLEGQEQTVWRVSDPEVAVALQKRFRGAAIAIADGHHRYETALRYRDESGAGDDPLRPESWVLMTLTAVQDPGLVVLPTHRLVETVYEGREPTTEQVVGVVKRLASERFDIEETGPVPHLLSRLSEIGARQQGAVGVYFGDSRGSPISPDAASFDGQAREFGDPVSYLLRLKDGGGGARANDILRLHREILDRLREALGAARLEVHFTHSAGEAVCQVRAGNFAMAFLLNPVSVQEVFNSARAGRKMPEKSTYFYPKLTSGLILRSLEE